VRAAQRLVGALWRWHRRIGLAAALFVLLLSVTGIALNHSPGLALDQTYVQWQWLLRSYGDDSAARIGYRLDAGWLSRSTGGQLYFNSTEVTTCYDELVGALQTPDFVLAACADQLVLLLPDGQLIEALTTSGGLPTPVAGIGRVEYGGQPAIALQVGSQWRLADVDTLQFHEPVPAGALVEQPEGAMHTRAVGVDLARELKIAPGIFPVLFTDVAHGQSNTLIERLVGRGFLRKHGFCRGDTREQTARQQQQDYPPGGQPE